MKTPPTEIEDLRRELERLRGAARDLSLELEHVRRQSAQAVALAREETHAEARMEHLEAVLDLGPITRHVREAITRATLVHRPSARAVVEGLLPPAVQQAAVEAIPAPIFSAGPSAQPGEIALPPKPAPTYAVATWLFLNDLARDVIGPALADRMAETPARARATRLRLSRSRLVPRPLQGPSPVVTSQEGETVSLVVPLDDRYDWHLVFDWTDKPVPSSRRRHGDITTWGPAHAR